MVNNEFAKNIHLCNFIRAESIGKGQGFLRCTCGGQCITKKCNCLKAGAKCNSHCHGGSLCTCKNIPICR